MSLFKTSFRRQSGSTKHEGKCAVITIVGSTTIHIQAKSEPIAARARLKEQFEEGAKQKSWMSWYDDDGHDSTLHYGNSLSFTLPDRMRLAASKDTCNNIPELLLQVALVRSRGTPHVLEEFVVAYDKVHEMLAITNATSKPHLSPAKLYENCAQGHVETASNMSTQADSEGQCRSCSSDECEIADEYDLPIADEYDLPHNFHPPALLTSVEHFSLFQVADKETGPVPVRSFPLSRNPLLRLGASAKCELHGDQLVIKL